MKNLGIKMNVRSYRKDVRASNNAFFRSLDETEKDARCEGTFFTTLEALVMERNVSIQPSQFPVIRRNPQQGSVICPRTADDEILNACEEAAGSTAKSDLTHTNQLVTTVDFLNEVGERTYLFPNAPFCHATFSRIAQAASGILSDDHYKLRTLLNGVIGRTQTLSDSGIKHSKFNKYHLFLQKQLFEDSPPSLIIIPLLSLEQIKQWNGTQSYEAMALSYGGLTLVDLRLESLISLIQRRAT